MAQLEDLFKGLQAVKKQDENFARDPGVRKSPAGWGIEGDGGWGIEGDGGGWGGMEGEGWRGRDGGDGVGGGWGGWSGGGNDSHLGFVVLWKCQIFQDVINGVCWVPWECSGGIQRVLGL